MSKQELIALAKELLQEEHLENRSEDLNLLKREYKRLLDRDEDSYLEKEESDKFFALFNELAKKVPSLLLSPYEEKKKILEKMKGLLDSKDYRFASKEMDKLSEDFKKAGRCLKEQDDELWAEFKSLKDQFYENRKAYYESLDASNAEKRRKKEEIIQSAKEVCELKDFKEANQKMDELRNKWKEVGYSGKGDDLLWKEFAKVLDEFKEKKKEHHYEMLKVFEERANKKEELIKKAKKILANSDFSDEEVASVKALRNEYKEIGFAGKEKEEELYQAFNSVIQKYFEELKFYK